MKTRTMTTGLSLIGLFALAQAPLAIANGDSLKLPPEPTKTETSPRVDLSNLLSKLKIKGRAAVGFFDSGSTGSFPQGSFEAPEAKLQFSIQPDSVNTLVMRFDLNNARFNSVDYLYLQSKNFLPCLKNTPFSLDGRLGRFKLGFGEETWSNNPVESVLPSNSAENTTVSDEGLELAGKIKLDSIKLSPLGWAVSASNGNSGTGSDTTRAKAWFAKLYHTPVDPLYLSVSFYHSGALATATPEFAIARLTTMPTGSTNWKRRVWEAFARYDFGKGEKPLDPPAYNDSKAFVRLSYGQFADDPTGGTDRDGQFGFVEGTYNITPKFYAAARYSQVKLDNNITASLNGVTANKYERYSLGGGYRWSEITIIKISYDWNKEAATGISDPNDDLTSILVAFQV